MDRHAFLDAQEWLEALPAGQPATASSLHPPVATAFAGAASMHLSPAEQQGSVSSSFKGPLAPDAVHLSFATSAPAEDPMQLRLQVDISLPAAAELGAPGAVPLPRQQVRVALTLDGRRYRLLLARALRLVLPQQLAARLPALLMQQLGAQPGFAHASAAGASRLGAGTPQASLLAAGAAEQPSAGFLCTAPPSQLPFLTLVFPHVCLNLYPLGWKAAAAHVSQEHDATELARLAQLLAECWLQQRLLGSAAPPAMGSVERGDAAANGVAGAADESGSGPSGSGGPDWAEDVRAWQRGMHALVAAAGQLFSGPAAELAPAAAAATTSEPAAQLAAAAASLQGLGKAAEAALACEKAALQAAQQEAGAALEAAAGTPRRSPLSALQLEAPLARLQQQQAAVAACSLLASTREACPAAGKLSH